VSAASGRRGHFHRGDGHRLRPQRRRRSMFLMKSHYFYLRNARRRFWSAPRRIRSIGNNTDGNSYRNGITGDFTALMSYGTQPGAKPAPIGGPARHLIRHLLFKKIILFSSDPVSDGTAPAAASLPKNRCGRFA